MHNKWIDESVVERLYELKNEEFSENTIADILSREFNHYTFTKDSVGNFYRRNKNKNKIDEPDEEIINENLKLGNRLQRQRDLNRIERKSWREYSRISNFLEEYNKELVSLLQNTTDVIPVFNHYGKVGTPVGILHLSDLHFNEVVKLEGNEYNYEIASKRLKLLVNQAKIYFNAFNIKDILIVGTGDFINSDRHLDELITNTTVRARAVFVAVRILAKVLIDLNKDFNVTFSGVTGNESRIGKELSYNQLIATDNYDYSIYNMLKLMFAVSETSIKFKLGNPLELVCKVNNQNILISHGLNLPNEGVLKRKVAEVYGRYSLKNISLRMILFGHYHSTIISDYFARSSSLVGSNSYSEFSLNAVGRASQNLHVVYEDGRIDSIKVDLQNTDTIDGYPLDEETLKHLNYMNDDQIIEI